MDFRERVRDTLKNMGIDITPHNFIDDLFIRKYIEINQPLDRKVEEVPEKLNFRNFNNLNMSDLEMFAGNFFVNVNEGDKATGSVRIYFSEPTDSFVPEGATFLAGDLKFFTESESEKTADEMVNFSEGIYYYHEVNVVAEEEGSEYIVTPGSINDTENSGILARSEEISNPYSTVGGSDPETPESLYDRIPDGLSGKSFINDPAISGLLRENFNVREIYTVPTGHEFMERDVVVIDGHEYRVGNKFDVWVNMADLQEKTAIIEKTSVDPEVCFGFSLSDFITTDSDYTCETIEGPLEDVIIDVSEVKYLGEDGEQSTEVAYNFSQEQGYEYSTHQESYIEITDEWDDAVGQIEITYRTSASLHEMQYFSLDKNNRLPVSDPLIRHFELLPLSGIIEYKGEDALDDDEMTELMNDYITDYDYEQSETEKVFEVSDIVDAMYRFGYATKVNFPLELEIEGTIVDDEYTLLRYQTLDPFIATSKV